jgi:cadmium resistance protein CadD (predicted permease)
MDTLPATVITAVGLFAGTNVDDMMLLAVLSASSRATGRPRRWEIWAGQYLAIAILVGVSLAASLGLDRIPQGWLWLLGLIPLSLGLYRLAAAIRAHRRGERPPAPAPGGLPGVTGLIVANGGDNVAAYAPVFAAIGAAAAAVTIAVFAVCVAIWCLAGSWLVSHHRVTQTLERWGHWIIPVIYILIGLYIFQKEGALSHLR